MNFSEALSKIKDAPHLCMISDSLLLTMRWDAKSRYFLAAHPAERAWYQFAPNIEQFEVEDWRIINFPVGWKNGKLETHAIDSISPNPFVSSGSLEDMRLGRA